MPLKIHELAANVNFSNGLLIGDDKVGVFAGLEVSDSIRQAQGLSAPKSREVEGFGLCDAGGGHGVLHLFQYRKRGASRDIRAKRNVQAGIAKSAVGHRSAAKGSVGVRTEGDVRS